MKEIKAILTGLVVFSLMYLIGVFIQNNFNITYWSDGCRLFVGLFGGCISLFVIVIKYSNNLGL